MGKNTIIKVEGLSKHYLLNKNKIMQMKVIKHSKANDYI